MILKKKDIEKKKYLIKKILKEKDIEKGKL